MPSDLLWYFFELADVIAKWLMELQLYDSTWLMLLPGQNNGFTIIQNSTSLILVYTSNLFKYEVKISASIKETTHKTWQ